MKKFNERLNIVLKLLLYVSLSIAAVYFIINNISMSPYTRMAVDFMKHGTEQDVIEYSKKTENDLRDSLNLLEETSENDDNKEEEKICKEDTNKEEKAEENEENSEQEEKKYESLEALALDYPMGTIYYSQVMTMGEAQVQILCTSVIFGIIIGVNCFIFVTDKKRTLKQLAILYGINLIVTAVTVETVQILTLVLAYGAFAFVGIELQFFLASSAVFLLGFAINDRKYQRLLKEQDDKIKNVKQEKVGKKESKKKK